MRWFYDLKTMMKLMLSFGFISALMIMVGSLGISGMGEINANVTSLYERDMKGLTDVKDADILVLRVMRTVRQVMIETDPRAQEEQQRQLDRLDVELRASLDTIEKGLILPEGRAKLAEIRATYPGWMESVRETAKLAIAKDMPGALNAVHRALPQGQKVEGGLTEIAHFKHNLGKKAFDESAAVYSQSRTTLILSILASVLLAIVLSFIVGQSISKPMASAVGVLKDMAQGDFTRRLDLDTKDEVGAMARALNSAIESVRDALEQVRGVANDVATASQQLRASAEEISAGAQEQASSLEETAASLEEITSTVKQNAETAHHAATIAGESRTAADNGSRVVASAVQAMQEITTSSKRIADIISSIDEIAFQTNLLALNAAVEAARAGDQGRGFAVVAAEVRNLAQRSAASAKEIKALISDSVQKVETGSKHVNESGHTLQNIMSSVSTVTDMMGEVAAAAKEQNTGIEQVNTAISQMDRVTQGNASQTEEMSSTAEALATQAEQLQNLVGRFQLGDSAPPPKAPPKAPPKVVGAKRSPKKPARAVMMHVANAPPPAAEPPDASETRMRSSAPPPHANGTTGLDEF